MPQSPIQIMHDYVQRLGLKNTRQRDIVATEFFKHHGHQTADEILEQARRVDPKVSLATVYRTLKLLQECGLAHAHNFGDTHARFEPHVEDDGHHDHLICTKCGLILEFYDEKIEQLQLVVAKAYGFSVTHHKMELYGLCKNCSTN